MIKIISTPTSALIQGV